MVSVWLQSPLLAQVPWMDHHPTARLLWWSVGLFLLGFMISVLAIPAVRLFALRYQLTDVIDPTRKIHKQPTPRIGGVAFLAAFVVGVILVYTFLLEEIASRALVKEWTAMVLTAVAMFALGFKDDLAPLGAKKKLLIQLVICTVSAVFGFHLSVIRLGFELRTVELGWWGYPVTVVWLLSTTNLVNLIDGIDGLAAGVCLFVFATLTLTALMSVGAPVLLICVVMMGALLGFLMFNFPPAKIFMGDGGAYFLGFLIGQVGLAAEHKSTIAAALIVPMLALGVPIIDTTLAILRRGIRGLPLFMADREHVHHMLLDMGLSPRRVVLALYCVCAVLSLVAVSVFLNHGKGVVVALGGLFTLMLAAVLGLGYLRRENPWFQLSAALRTRGKTAYVVELCRLLKFEAQRTDSVTHFWREFGTALHKAQFTHAMFSSTDSDRFPDLQVGHSDGGRAWSMETPIFAGTEQVGRLLLYASRSAMDEKLFKRQSLLFRDALAYGLERLKGIKATRGSLGASETARPETLN